MPCPRVSWSALSELLGLAFALTIVALGQSISIAKAVAARSGQRIDANREFRGQGLSNIVGGFFSSYVSCGSLNRSMPNLEAGARTPLAAVFSAVLLLLLVALSASLLAQIPMAALAALLLLVAVSLLDLRRWKQLFALSRTEFGVALRHAGGDRQHPAGDRDPAGHAAVADVLSVPHLETGDAHHGLRQPRAGPAVCGAGRC